MKWRCRDRMFDLSDRGEIMGILNVTPDSFSDGGKYDAFENAVRHAEAMIEEGACIIDVGGESTRPGAPEVEAEEEKSRVVPVIEAIRAAHPSLCISVDTSKTEVAAAAVESGADIINDVTGFRDPEMIRLAAETGAGVVAMHMQGTPRTMQQSPEYNDVVREVRDFFSLCYEEMEKGGVDPEAMAFDPGIGFGKTLEHNLALLRSLDLIGVRDRPILLGVSRKSFIGKILDSDSLDERSWPTVAITSYAREKGVCLHRVHEVKANVEALRMTEAILGVT